MNSELSPREIELIKLLCDELPQKAIAVKMHIAVNTVRNMQSNVRKKMGVKTTVGMAVLAVKLRIYKP